MESADSSFSEQSCLGCRRSVNLYEKVNIDFRSNSLQNCSVPLSGKGSDCNDLLMSIISYLNGKGGTIYLGVDSGSEKVVGVDLNKKLMGELTVSIKGVIELIYPEVDLTASEMIEIMFVPVMEKDEGKDVCFGRYIVKIIVKPSNNPKFYCTFRSIDNDEPCTGSDSVKKNTYPIGYRRLYVGSGSIESIKGEKLLKEVHDRAIRSVTEPQGSNLLSAFHANCNPQPLAPQIVERRKEVNPNDTFEIQKKHEGPDPEKHQLENIINQISFQPQKNPKGIHSQVKKQTEAKVFARKTQPQEARPQVLRPMVNHSSGLSIRVTNIDPVYYGSLMTFFKFNVVSNVPKKIIDDDMQKHITLKFENLRGVEEFMDQVQSIKVKAVLKKFVKGTHGEDLIYKRVQGSKVSRQEFRTHNQQQQPTIVNPIKNPVLPNNLSQPESVKAFLISFQNCEGKSKKSLEKYIKNSINPRIPRIPHHNKKSDDFQLYFLKKSDMNEFYKICNEKVHFTQLNQFGYKNSLKIVLMGSTQLPKVCVKMLETHRQPYTNVPDYHSRCMNDRYEEDQSQQLSYDHSYNPNQLQAGDLHESTYYEYEDDSDYNNYPPYPQQYDEEGYNEEESNPPYFEGYGENQEGQSYELEDNPNEVSGFMNQFDDPNMSSTSQEPGFSVFLTGVQPKSMQTLLNYLRNNMHYNIHKNMYASALKYWVRLQFKSAGDAKNFLKKCKLELHWKTMAQYTSNGEEMRIGIVAKKILVYPYEDAIKKQLKNRVLKALGQEVIKSSSVKERDFGGNNGRKDSEQGDGRMWVLKLLDPETQLFEAYERLKQEFEGESISMGGENIRPRVEIEYEFLV